MKRLVYTSMRWYMDEDFGVFHLIGYSAVSFSVYSMMVFRSDQSICCCFFSLPDDLDDTSFITIGPSGFSLVPHHLDDSAVLSVVQVTQKGKQVKRNCKSLSSASSKLCISKFTSSLLFVFVPSPLSIEGTSLTPTNGELE